MHIIVKNAGGEQTFEVKPPNGPDTTAIHVANHIFEHKLKRSVQGELVFQLFLVASQQYKGIQPHY